jgi:CubicO group peptidase (beta-lactamase class C family)
MRQRFSAAVAVSALVLMSSARFGGAQTPPSRSASEIDLTRLEAIEALVRHDIEQKRLPGAVVLVGLGDRIIYQKAIGDRALVPAREAMTLDTIFDLASLTKVVATTTSVMMLIEQGKLRLIDRVSTFIPGFERYGKADITVRHLLTHISGLRPDVDLGDTWSGTDNAIKLAIEEVPTSPPGSRFVYSDINFFLLGEIVKRVSGQRRNMCSRAWA